MPEIVVYLFEGRSLDQKRSLVQALTGAASAALSVPAEAIDVQLIENSPSMRARGGVLFSDRIVTTTHGPS